MSASKTHAEESKESHYWGLVPGDFRELSLSYIESTGESDNGSFFAEHLDAIVDPADLYTNFLSRAFVTYRRELARVVSENAVPVNRLVERPTEILKSPLGGFGAVLMANERESMPLLPRIFDKGFPLEASF